MIETYNFLFEFNLWFILNCVVVFSGQFWKLVPEEAGTLRSHTCYVLFKVEIFLKDSLDLIPSSSVNIQIMGGKVCLRCKGKTLLGFFNKLLYTKSLLTSPSNAQRSEGHF